MRGWLLHYLNNTLFISDTILPYASYILIGYGIYSNADRLIWFGLAALAIYWLSQCAIWLGYINRRIDKYVAPLLGQLGPKTPESAKPVQHTVKRA